MSLDPMDDAHEPETNSLADMLGPGCVVCAAKPGEGHAPWCNLVEVRAHYGLPTRPSGTPNTWVFLRTERGTLALPKASIDAVEADYARGKALALDEEPTL